MSRVCSRPNIFFVLSLLMGLGLAPMVGPAAPLGALAAAVVVRLAALRRTA